MEVVHDPFCPLAQLLTRFGAGAVGMTVDDGTDVRRFTPHVLAVPHSPYSLVELGAAVAAADEYRFAKVLSQRLQRLLAQVLDIRHQLRRHPVVDMEPSGRPRPLELL